MDVDTEAVPLWTLPEGPEDDHEGLFIGDPLQAETDI